MWALFLLLILRLLHITIGFQSSFHTSYKFLKVNNFRLNLDAGDISDLTVKSLDGSETLVSSLLNPSKHTVLACLTHFGDFNAWELAQNLKNDLQELKKNGSTEVICIGIGSSSAASKFAEDLDLDNSNMPLYADEEGKVTSALGCYKGWLYLDDEHRKKWPASDVNPYIKLFGMIFGLGSPGTIGKVLRGYIGDERGGKKSREWVVESLLQGGKKNRFPALTEKAFKNTPIDSGLKPFELATLRLQTGLHIVLNWGILGPKNGDMFTRMGGVFVFKKESGEVVFKHYDQGILTYVPRDDLLKAVKNL